MTKPMFLAIMAIAVSSGTGVVHAVGQEPEPPPAVPTGEETTTSGLAVDVAKMTLDEAYEAIVTAEARGPDAEDAMKRLGELLPAIRRRDPLNDDVNFIDGRVKLLLGFPRQAIQLIGEHYVKRKRDGKLEPDKVKNEWLAFKLLGDLYFQAKYYKMAQGKYKRAVELDPREPEPYAGLARTELALGDPHEAVEYAREAINRDNPGSPSERDPKYHATLAAALLGNRKPDEAFKAATTAVELAREKAQRDSANPALLVALDSYNQLLEQISQTIVRKSPASAEQYARFPESAEKYAPFPASAEQYARFPERAEEYARMARIGQERAQIAHLLSLHHILHTLEQDIERIERIEQQPPPTLLLEKARLLLAIGNVEEAIVVLTNLLEEDPDNGEAKQLLYRSRGPEPGTPSGR